MPKNTGALARWIYNHRIQARRRTYESLGYPEKSGLQEPWAERHYRKWEYLVYGNNLEPLPEKETNAKKV